MIVLFCYGCCPEEPEFTNDELKKYLFVDLLFKSYGDRMILQRLGFYFFLFFFFIFINFLFINTYFSKFFKANDKI